MAKSKSLEERFNFDDVILGNDFEDAFFEGPKRVKLKKNTSGIESIERKNKAFKKAYKSRKMFPLPVSDIAGDVVKLAPYQVIPEAMKKKEGDFIEVPVKLARTKKTRLY